jgi:hypothetical protein
LLRHALKTPYAAMMLEPTASGRIARKGKERQVKEAKVSRVFLAVVMAAVVLGTSAEADAGRRSHPKLHDVHFRTQNQSPYPVASYSVPQWGPYSGYQYYDDSYPIYLDHVRPYLSGKSVYQPNTAGYADYGFGCCGASQHTRVTGVVSRNGVSVESPFGWTPTQP